MNRIIFVIPSMSGGGAERVVANLSEELVIKGKEVTILMTSGEKVDYELDNSIKLVCCGDETKGSIKKIINRLIILRKFIKDNQNAGFICMETNSNLYMLLSSVGLHINMIVSERNDPNRYNHTLIRNVIYRLLARKIVFQTEDAKACIKLSVNAIARVIANPLRDNLPKILEGEKSKKIVAVGRLEPQKNYNLLLKAFKKALVSIPDYILRIYGKGYMEKEIADLAMTLGISDKVQFMGFISEPWMDARKDDIYVLSSDYEGMPNALIEAMGMGMPVISTDCPIGGPKELIEDGVNGLLVPVGDEEALCEAMLRLARDGELRERLSKEAIRIREKLNVSNIASQWLDMLEQ